MGWMWVIVGFIAGLSLFVYNELWKALRIDWKGWAGLILGEALILFCIAWCVASIFEGEPRTASMGLIFMGGPGLVVLVLTWRFLIQKSARTKG